jgi:hypothetical protein
MDVSQACSYRKYISYVLCLSDEDLHVRVVRMAAADERALRSVQLGALARSLLTQRS